MAKIILNYPISIKIGNKTYKVEYKKPKQKEIEELDNEELKRLKEKSEIIINRSKLYKNKYETAIELGDEEAYQENYEKYKELEEEAENLKDEVIAKDEQLQRDLFFLQISGEDSEELYNIAKEYNLFEDIYKNIKEQLDNKKK